MLAAVECTHCFSFLLFFHLLKPLFMLLFARAFAVELVRKMLERFLLVHRSPKLIYIFERNIRLILFVKQIGYCTRLGLLALRVVFSGEVLSVSRRHVLVLITLSIVFTLPSCFALCIFFASSPFR